VLQLTTADLLQPLEKFIVGELFNNNTTLSLSARTTISTQCYVRSTASREIISELLLFVSCCRMSQEVRLFVISSSNSPMWCKIYKNNFTAD